MTRRVRTGFGLLTLLAATLPASGSASSASSAWMQRPAQSGTVELTITEGTSMAVAVSPDGRTLVMDLQGTLWTLPISGGVATPILDAFHDARQPAWSPDGTTIVFQSYRRDSWDIWSVGRDGRDARPLTSGPFDDREPHWSPDGGRIAFSSDRGGNYDIWTLDLDTGITRQLTDHPANDFAPAWSPDGREIAFVSGRGSSTGVWAVGWSNGGTRQLTSFSGAVSAPAWRPGGIDIIFSGLAGNESALVLTTRVISEHEDVFGFRPGWLSADEVVYTADGLIKRRRLSTGTVDTIPFAAELAFTRRPYTQNRRAFDSVAPRQALGIMTPVLSPDGEQIAFAALGDLWLMPIDGPPRRLTNDRFVDIDPAWSPDGAQLAFSSDRAGTMDLWVHDIASGRDRRLTSQPTAAGSPVWSPNGRLIAFKDNTGAYYTVTVEAGTIAMVHRPLSRAGRPTWGPSGRLLATTVLEPYSSRYREGTSQLLLFSIDGDIDRDRSVVPVAHRLVGTRQGDGPVWSPDGTMMAFVMDGTLHVMPVRPDGQPTGPPRQLTGDVADSPSWSGDSGSLLYQSADRLRLVSVDTARVRDVPLELRWQPTRPTGRTVVHAGGLFDGVLDVLQPEVDLVVAGNRIVAIEPHRDELHNDHEGRIIDASDATVMPGLIEMHTHLNKQFGEPLGRIFLAYGITTVRVPAGSPYDAIENREAFASGVRVGPRVFTTGYTFDGPRIFYPGSLGLSAGPQLDRELERARALRYDLLKTYVRLPDLLQQRVIDFGHEHGIPVTSHELYPAVALGADGVEHIGGTSRRGYSPKRSLLQRSYGDVVGLLAASGMTLTPTISIGGFQLMALRHPDLLRDPRFERLFPRWTVRAARSAVERAARGGLDIRRARAAAQAATVLALTRAGGRVIAGTDSPIMPYAISLHTELEHFVDGGLTPFEALRTATVNAAAALGSRYDLGTLEPGKLADLVIVEGNPLRDITHTRRVRAVMKNGSFFELETLLGTRGAGPATLQR